MIEKIEKALLMGLGALSLTQKKAEELKDELKEQFDLSEEKGRELVDKLQAMAAENQQKLEEIARDEASKAAQRLGLVTRDEIDALTTRIVALEKRLDDTNAS